MLMTEIALKSFEESKPINKQEALQFINNNFYHISRTTKAYLCGFDLVEKLDEKRNPIFQKLNKNQYARNHKEDFLPQLKGLSYLLEYAKNSLTKFVLFEYYYDPTLIEHNKSFFSDWGEIIIKNPKMLELKTMEEWFVIILEDKMTLDAAYDKKIKVDLSYYKSQFYFSDNSFLSKIKDKYPHMKFLRDRELLVGFNQLKNNKYEVLINPTLDSHREIVIYNKKEFEQLTKENMKEV